MSDPKPRYWWEDPSWEEYCATCPYLHCCDVCGESGLWTPLHQDGDLWLCEVCAEEEETEDRLFEGGD